MVAGEDRVKIWNSYLCESHNFAKKLKTGGTLECLELAGGTLPFEKHCALMTILHLALAIDARTNHLLHELKDNKVINKSLRDAIVNARGDIKWAFLPVLVGKEIIRFDNAPHQAITEIYRHRNNFVHLVFRDEEFIDKIPDKDRTIILYNHFIDAMEDMNVILGRAEPERQYVKKLKV